MTTALQPVGPNIVVRPLEKNRTTPGGIALPDRAESESTQFGEVIAVGSGFALQDGSRMALEIKVGDVVHFPRTAGGVCVVDGKRYRVMSEREVFAREN